MENDNGDVEQKEFGIRDIPSAILDQYLGGDEFEEVIPEEGNVFNNNLP